jgi:hypothetical protein
MTRIARPLATAGSTLTAAGAAVALAACATAPGASGARSDAAFSGCPAYTPAYEATDAFMRTFNARDSAAWGATLHFPHVRIASSNVRVINSSADLDESFERLIATGWDHSGWAARRIVQCGPTKAHMLTTFVRYRADNSELSRFDSLYIVEQKNGKWAITARSSFAP